jgi:hypothetical protein
MRTLVASALALTVAGCSSTNIGDWVGNWNAGVAQTTTCPGAAMTTTQLTGAVVISAGTATDTIVTTPASYGCALTYTVSGDGATLEAGQHCGSGEGETDFSSGGLTLNGNSIAVGAAGTNQSNGQACTFNQVGQFTRGT